MLESRGIFDSFINDAFLTFLSSTEDIVFLKDANLTYVAASNAFAALVGKDSGSELVGKTDFDVFADQELAKRYREDDKRLLELGEPLLDYIEPMPGKNGSYAYSSTCKYIVRDAQGKAAGVWGMARDITREFEARIHYERELQYLFELPEAALSTALFDITGWRVVNIRSKIGRERATSYFETIDEFVEHINAAVIEGDEARVFFHTFSPETLQDIYDSGKRNFSVEYLRRMPEGTELWVRSELHFLSDPVNGHLSLLITLLDIDAERRSRDTMARAAERDAMTNLLNRDATMRYIEQFLEQEGAGKSHALFLIDLDNFKQVNDTFGHQLGDTVLVQAAGLIRSNFRESDIVGRIGGDEFFALMKHVESPEHVQSKAQQLVAALQYVCTTPSVQVELSSSVGISLTVGAEKTLKNLYAEADAALYEAKREGKNRYSVFHAPSEAETDTVAPACPVINTVNLHTLLNKIDAGVIIFRAGPGETMPVPAFFNDSLLALMGGLTRKEAMKLYRDPLSAVHPEDLDRVYEEFKHSYSMETVLHTSFRMCGKDDVYFWVSVGTTVTRHANGGFDAYAVYNSIDYLMQTEAELREKSRILDLAMKNTDINLWFWDMASKDCTLTPNCKIVHGIDMDVLHNFPQCLMDMNYVREDSVDAMRNGFAQLEAGVPEVTYDAWYRQNDGVGYWCERVVLTAVYDKAGVPVRAIGIGKNVTATKEFEQKYLAVKSGLRPIANSVGSCILNLTANLCVEAEGCMAQLSDAAAQSTTEVLLQRLYGQVLSEQDREQLEEAFARAALLKQHACGSTTVSREYLSCGCVKDSHGTGMYRWLRTTAEMMENPSTGEVEALVYCVDIDEEKRIQLTMEKLLATDYEMLCQVEAQTGRFVLFSEKMNGQMLNHDCGELYYDKALERVLQQFVADECCEQAIAAMQRQNILHELEGKPLYTCSFPSKAVKDVREGHRQWRFSYLDETHSILLITRTDVTDMFSAETDPLTGLHNRQAFYRHVRRVLDEDPQGDYAIVRYDLDRFKAYNDAFGTKAGDRLLVDMGRALCENSVQEGAFWARLDADHFVAIGPADSAHIDLWNARQAQWLEEYSPSFHLTCSVGAYVITDPDIDVSFMCDRALLALKTVKTRYDTTVGWYDDSMRRQLIEEQTLIDETGDALQQNQFVVYYQPQVNYADGTLIGAEALVRWNHPQRGLIGPDGFIPLFEKNGFISRLDEYVWEQVCRYMRAWSVRMDQLFPVPISVNLSRINLYDQTLCDKLCALVDRYEIPRANLRLEITESAYMDNPEQLINVVKRLKQMGFTVEMDDFGAGYSSLNTLKDVPVDVLKLDVRFLSSGEDNARGGNILSSVIRMAHWLKVPVVAEGVETKTQADYLKSLSCFYMQGYYFSRPMPEENFSQMLEDISVGNINRFADVDLDGVAAFWDPSAQNALLFNSFVGGASIVEYHNGAVELVRANDRFFVELDTSRELYLSRQFNVLGRFAPANRLQYETMLKTTIEIGGEAECEVESLPTPDGQQGGWTYNRARLLAKNDNRYLIYISVQNVTPRKEMEAKLRIQQQELETALKQIGALVCRYNVAEKTLTLPEEYARDNNLAPVLQNVPDAILPMLLEDDRPVYEMMFREIAGGTKCGQASVRFVCKDGSMICQHHTFTTVMDSEGNPARAIISIKGYS